MKFHIFQTFDIKFNELYSSKNMLCSWNGCLLRCEHVFNFFCNPVENMQIGRTIKQQLQHDMAYKINNLCWCGKIEMSILYIIIWFSHFVLTFESYAWHVDLLWIRHGTPTTCDLCPHGLQKWFIHFVVVFFPRMDIIAMWKENHKGNIL
jgi:hypothetical protein